MFAEKKVRPFGMTRGKEPALVFTFQVQKRNHKDSLVIRPFSSLITSEVVLPLEMAWKHGGRLSPTED